MVMFTPRLPWFEKNENGENGENVLSALPNLLKPNHFDRRSGNRFCSDALALSLSAPSVSGQVFPWRVSAARSDTRH